MTGSGTDEQTIIDILTHRTWEQREDIITHNFLTVEYFRAWIADEIGGTCGVIIRDLVYSPAEILAFDLLWAVKGSGTNEQMLIDILVPMTAAEMKRAKTLFKMNSDYSLAYYVTSDTKDEGNRQSAGLIDQFLSHCLNHRYCIVPNLHPKPIYP